jgi:hypothetical protein
MQANTCTEQRGMGYEMYVKCNNSGAFACYSSIISKTVMKSTMDMKYLFGFSIYIIFEILFASVNINELRVSYSRHASRNPYRSSCNVSAITVLSLWGREKYIRTENRFTGGILLRYVRSTKQKFPTSHDFY